MSNQPDTVKENIMDWFKEDSISFTDISEKNPNFTWIPFSSAFSKSS